MKYGINIGKVVSALMVVVLTVSSAACGAGSSAGSSGDSGASNAKTAQSGNPFEKKDGVFTASEAFSIPSYWYRLEVESWDETLPTKNSPIQTVYRFEGNGKVTRYSTDVLTMCQTNTEKITFADIKDTSPQAFVKQLEEGYKTVYDRCVDYFRNKLPQDREEASCPGTKAYDRQDEMTKNALKAAPPEVCGEDDEVIARDLKWWNPPTSLPTPSDFSLAIETDDTGNNTKEEELQIGDWSFELRPQPYPAAVYTKKYSGYEWLVTQTGENTSFQLDQPGTPGVKVDED